jgi:hypothetical protein
LISNNMMNIYQKFRSIRSMTFERNNLSTHQQILQQRTCKHVQMNVTCDTKDITLTGRSLPWQPASSV